MNKEQCYFAIDLELNNAEDNSTLNPKIIQIGIAVGSCHDYVNQSLVTYKWFLDPKEPIFEFITQLTGISDQDIPDYSVPHGQVAKEIGEIITERNCFLNPITWGGGDSLELYEEMLEKGVAREIARMVLPVNVYTEFYWKIDAHNLMHFLNLRCDAHAQEEIRVYALAIRDILAQWMPVTHKAFLDYVVNARTYSGGEVDLITNSLDPERFELNCEKAETISAREMLELKKSLGMG